MSDNPTTVKLAARAVAQASEFARRVLANRRPRVDITEEGIVTFHWRTPELGVLLLFAGDDIVNCSIKRAGGQFGMSDIPVPTRSELPNEVSEVIELIERRPP